jgi:formylglycine-generating enzyme required for sulfatase activity
MGKRLLSEWEWEKAAKAVTTSKYYWGNEMKDGYSNTCDGSCPPTYRNEWTKEKQFTDSFKNTALVRSFKQNAWSLYMAGNVWEWTVDWHKDFELSGGIFKILRGGSWADPSRFVQSGFRYSYYYGKRTYFTGFRYAK